MDERIIKYFTNKLSSEERKALLKDSLTDSALREKMLFYQNLEAFLHLSPEKIDREAGKKSYDRLQKQKNRKIIRRHLLTFISYAASICLLLGITYAFTSRYYTTLVRSEEPQGIIPEQELYVPPGQMARITLPDGTVSWLNAGSTLVYPSLFTGIRKVTLSGEAYFEVAENKEMPFVVSTEFIDVTALGTEFNVYSYPGADYVSATLIEGSIVVNTKQEDFTSIYVNPDQKVIYEQGELRLEKSINRDKLLWKEGIYSFKITSLKDIIKQLEIYYDVEIQVTDPSILDYEYTGKFLRSDGIMEILRIIGTIHPYKIKRDKESNRITLYK
ncbi:MAG: DUF4974 domain-containing protein [Tannerellaceae bacterium]|nr:DUF4974 domain-containing protein [Tannerellaceae bacterium]